VVAVTDHLPAGRYRLTVEITTDGHGMLFPHDTGAMLFTKWWTARGARFERVPPPQCDSCGWWFTTPAEKCVSCSAPRPAAEPAVMTPVESREPRVWKFGVHSDIDPDVTEVVGDVTGIRYRRVEGKKFSWRGNVMELGVGALLFDEGTLTEVLPTPAAPRPGDTVRLWLDNDTSVVGRYYVHTEDGREYVEANGQHRLVEVNGRRRPIEVVQPAPDGGEPR
jgi:hypothetical protein